MPVIKRYSNRKMYDSETRRYVTLDEVAQMIRCGEEVEIVDHLTGIDLTAVTMAQIIFEQEKKIGGYLPRNVLARIIRSGTRTMRELQNNLQAFLDPEQYFEDELRRRFEVLISRKHISEDDMARLVDRLLDSTMRKKTQKEEIYDEDTATLEDIENLVARIEEIEKELQAISDHSSA